MECDFDRNSRTNCEAGVMSQVVLLIDRLGDNKADVIRRLRVTASITVGDAIRAIERGEPIFRRCLFGRFDPGFPDRLLEFLEWCERNSVSYHAFEIRDYERFDKAKTRNYYVLNAFRLEGIIQTIKASIERQRRLGHLESGE